MENNMFIGIDIGGTNMRAALVDLHGQIMHQRKLPTSMDQGAEDTSRRLAEACRSLIKKAQGHGCSVEAIGLGVAGKIDRLQGRVLFSPHLPSMRGYPLALELQNALGIAVIAENDANAFGLGENWIGSGRGIRNWLGLTLGTGVGGCLILDGRLWNGDDLGFVAETGHMVINPKGPQCACGLRGCLEAQASGSALVTGVREALAEGTLQDGPLFNLSRMGKIDPEGIYRCACEGDPLAQRLFDRMGWALGLAIANLFTFLGIRQAILGGGVSGAWDRFIDPLKRSLMAHSSMLSPSEALIERSTLGDNAALIGAAWLASHHFLTLHS